MHELSLSHEMLPEIKQADSLTASSTFVHADRTTDFNVLIYVTSGRIPVSEDGVDYCVEADEVLFLKNGVHHCGSQPIPAGTSWHYVHFRLPSTDANDTLTIPKKLRFHGSNELEPRLRELIAHYNSDDISKSWTANALLFLLLSDCAFYRGTSQTLSERLMMFLDSAYSEPFHAETLEKHFFLSYKRLEAVFHEETGTTLQRYHAAVRMRSAASLLRSTTLSVGEVADKLGFADQLYFSRCFHRYYGLSPTKYRESISLDVF